MKVLISAYACEPHKGSEGGVGWNWAKQIAKFAEVWVITRANNRGVIEEELKKNPASKLHFSYYDVPKWLSFWKKKTRGLYFYYLLWQIGVYRIAKKIHKQKKFDVVHQLTFGNLWLPTFIPFFKISFIWGPVGGGEQVPKQFRKSYPLKAKVQEMLRDFILTLLKFNPLFLYTCRRARVIIARTKDTLNKIPISCRDKTLKMIETGMDTINISVKTEANRRAHIYVLLVGRLIHLKGFDLGSKAFARAFRGHDAVRMIIIGDGPDRGRLKRISQDEDISEQVLFTGHLNHETVLNYMSKSDIFLFPSLKEGGAWVLFEAMLAGLPIICLDIAGTDEIIDGECGIKIKPVTLEQTINDFAKALVKLATEPELRRKMGTAGRKRVTKLYTWDKKGEIIAKIYGGIK